MRTTCNQIDKCIELDTCRIDLRYDELTGIPWLGHDEPQFLSHGIVGTACSQLVDSL